MAKKANTKVAPKEMKVKNEKPLKKLIEKEQSN